MHHHHPVLQCFRTLLLWSTPSPPNPSTQAPAVFGSAFENEWYARVRELVISTGDAKVKVRVPT